MTDDMHTWLSQFETAVKERNKELILQLYDQNAESDWQWDNAPQDVLEKYDALTETANKIVLT